MTREFRHLLAIDPSLTCSGWALFSLRTEAPIAAGKVKSDPPSMLLAERFMRLQKRIESLFDTLGLGGQDVLVCEGATSMKDPHNALKVEHVRSIFETVGRSRAACVPGRINPRSVQHEIMGLYGKQIPRREVKATAVQTALALFQNHLERLGLIGEGQTQDLIHHQDVVDALLVGRFAITRFEMARNGSLSLEEVFQESRGRSRSGTWRAIDANRINKGL